MLFPLAAPLVDIFFVYGLLFGDPATTLVLWGSMLVLQTAAAAYAFRLDGEPWGPLWVAPLQQLVYRPLMYAVLVRSLLSAVTGGRVRWQRIQRLGALRALMPGASGVTGRRESPRCCDCYARRARRSRTCTTAAGRTGRCRRAPCG